jgi:signal transduction histidine kinase
MVRLRMGPGVVVPLAVEGHAFGAIQLARRRGSAPFGDREVRVAESLTAEAAVAVAFGQARDELARLAVLDDRERIAKDLHDGVIQSLFSVGMGLSGLALRSRDDHLRRRIEDAVEELDRVIREVRSYIFMLRSGALGERELGDTLRKMAAEVQERTGVVVAVQLDQRAVERLRDQASDVIHLVREALSNVARHADADTCRVSLRLFDGATVIEVDDDGRGFDPERARGRGEGLANLEARARAMGGSFDIESTADAGTTVRVRLPV